jgi:hypothetical protein
MNHWTDDKNWSDVFLPEIKRILGEQFIAEPPVEEDRERNTDLMVLRLDSIRVGCRVRRKFNWKGQDQVLLYGHEFTIRSDRPSGNKTELRKIIEGWGDYFFYGFSDETEKRLERWFIGDFNIFRGWVSDRFFKSEKSWVCEKVNQDGSSTFKVFRVDAIPGFVVASSWGDTNEKPPLLTGASQKSLELIVQE